MLPSITYTEYEEIHERNRFALSLVKYQSHSRKTSSVGITATAAASSSNYQAGCLSAPRSPSKLLVSRLVGSRSSNPPSETSAAVATTTSASSVGVHATFYGERDNRVIRKNSKMMIGNSYEEESEGMRSYLIPEDYIRRGRPSIGSSSVSASAAISLER